jgi:Ser/Thr protein kinase RdoA (MazF antagonist)
MIRAAERIAAGFDHLRVDFYDCGDRIHIGEVTVYPWSGLSRFNPDEADAMLGAYWTIRRPLRRAAMAILLRRREIRAATSMG